MRIEIFVRPYGGRRLRPVEVLGPHAWTTDASFGLERPGD